jgi:hypothetical protein
MDNQIITKDDQVRCNQTIIMEDATIAGNIGGGARVKIPDIAFSIDMGGPTQVERATKVGTLTTFTNSLRCLILFAHLLHAAAMWPM